MKGFIVILAIVFMTVVSADRCSKTPGLVIANPAVPKNCAAYIICSSESGVDATCPGGQEFDSEMGKCDDALKAGCSHPRLPCRGLLGRMVPHPLDCNQYYECTSEEGILKHCHPDQHFNRELQMCDTPFSANCIIR